MSWHTQTCTQTHAIKTMDMTVTCLNSFNHFSLSQPFWWLQFSSVQSLSRVQLFATPWTIACQASLSFSNSESTQTHVHFVDDAIQPSHPLLSPSPPALNLSQHHGSFQMSQLSTSGGQSIGVSASTSVPPMNTQDWSPLGWTDWISLQSKGLSRVFSNTTVQKHQFFGAQLSSQSDSHIHTWPLEKA